MRLFNPSKIAAPAATYSHGVEIEPNARWLCVAGQVGTKPDRTIDSTIEGQAERAWLNVVAILEGGGMSIKNLSQGDFLSHPPSKTFRLMRRCATSFWTICGPLRPRCRAGTRAAGISDCSMCCHQQLGFHADDPYPAFCEDTACEGHEVAPSTLGPMTLAATFLGGAKSRLLPPSVPFRFFAAAAVFHVLLWLVLLLAAGNATSFAGGLGRCSPRSISSPSAS